jgi:hypothetical protein
MKINLSKYRWAQLASLSLWPILLCAQSSDLAQNLADCMHGWQSCDHTRLSPSESADVALAEHRLNTRNCRNGYDSCDRSKLTEPEAIALAVADHRQNVSNCKNGTNPCDPLRLTQSEARERSITQLATPHVTK